MSDSININTSMQFHDTNIQLPVQLFDDLATVDDVNINNIHFGQYSITTGDLIDQSVDASSKIHIIFSVDCSGSMSESCCYINKYTKLEQVIITLTNVVKCLLSGCSGIVISIYGFNSEVFPIIVNQQITQDSVDYIIENISQMTASSLTNMELMSEHVGEACDRIHKADENTDIFHILMTDGIVTAGSNCASDLYLNMVNEKISHAFIGYGNDHDIYLLHSLSKLSNGRYYFIEDILNAGFVYGEIIHSIIYRLLTDITITIHSGEIYDFATGIWTSTIHINSIASNCRKSYQIRAKYPTYVHVDLTGFNRNISKLYSCVTMADLVFIDLSSISFRQKIQECLYDSIHLEYLSADNTDISIRARNLYQQIESYMTTNNLLDDLFMKSLRDDIHTLCIECCSHQTNRAYSVSRHYSQGHQGVYKSNITDITDDLFADNNNNDDYQMLDNIQSPYANDSVTQIMAYVNDGGNNANNAIIAADVDNNSVDIV